MTKKKSIILILLAVATVSFVAGVKCWACNGTGFGNKGKSAFTCTFCKGKGWQ